MVVCVPGPGLRRCGPSGRQNQQPSCVWTPGWHTQHLDYDQVSISFNEVEFPNPHCEQTTTAQWKSQLTYLSFYREYCSLMRPWRICYDFQTSLRVFAPFYDKNKSNMRSAWPEVGMLLPCHTEQMPMVCIKAGAGWFSPDRMNWI